MWRLWQFRRLPNDVTDVGDTVTAGYGGHYNSNTLWRGGGGEVKRQG